MIPTLVTALNADATMADQFNAIKHAWAMEPVETLSTDIPMCVVWSPSEQMAENERGDALPIAQMVGRIINVFCVCNYNVLDARLSNIRDVVHGWQFTANHTKAALLEGELVQINGDLIWWLDTYVTKVQLQQS